MSNGTALHKKTIKEIETCKTLITTCGIMGYTQQRDQHRLLSHCRNPSEVFMLKSQSMLELNLKF
jgi:hypothetical protein